MYGEPCYFCRGLCGARTKEGKACSFYWLRCRTKEHKEYRGFTNRALRYWIDMEYEGVPHISQAGLKRPKPMGIVEGSKTVDGQDVPEAWTY